MDSATISVKNLETKALNRDLLIALWQVAEGIGHQSPDGTEFIITEINAEMLIKIFYRCQRLDRVFAAVMLMNKPFFFEVIFIFNIANDFFKNILDFGVTWKATSEDDQFFEGRDRRTGEVKYTGSRVDLIFGSNSELRALAEVYATDDVEAKFVKDFVKAWDKVMNLDRYDLKV